MKKLPLILVGAVLFHLWSPTAAEAHYSVEKDDSLYKIAQKHNMTLKEILSLNLHIPNPDLIYPGQHINITTPKQDNAAHDREAKIDDLIDYARSLQSVTKYELGANSAPYVADCSSWTQHIYKKFGVELPRISKDQAKTGQPVKFDEIQKGDLLFFADDNKNISHVGIYIGDDFWISNLNSTKDVVILSTWETWSFDKFMWGTRVI